MSTEVETLDILSAADMFMEQIDDNGAMPGDDDYVEPEVAEVEEEEVAEEESEEEEAEETEEESEEEEEETEGGEKPAKEEDEDPLFEIEIDGEAYEVNAEELKAGYLRNEEFVGRTTKLEQEYVQKATVLTEKEVQIDAELEALVGLQNQELQRFRNVNWAELKMLDPTQYNELRNEFHEAQDKANMFLARKAQLNEARTQAQAIKHQAFVKEQQALAARLVPEFRDPEFQKSLIKYGENIGWSESEIRDIADARVLMLLNQSRLYAQSQLKRKEALEKKVPKDVPKVVKPGAPQAVSKGKIKAAQSAAQNLKSSGSLNAARDYFLTAGLI